MAALCDCIYHSIVLYSTVLSNVGRREPRHAGSGSWLRMTTVGCRITEDGNRTDGTTRDKTTRVETTRDETTGDKYRLGQ
jgi:hypothetical protein